jgi:hypothetical protein
MFFGFRMNAELQTPWKAPPIQPQDSASLFANLLTTPRQHGPQNLRASPSCSEHAQLLA